MNTRELEYILAIAKEKSISKAAEKLYVTQPALSLFLTRLESQLGTPLFIRGGLRSHPHLCRGALYPDVPKGAQGLPGL